MIKISNTATREEESDRFRDTDIMDREHFKKTGDWRIAVRGTPRKYYERRAEIDGMEIAFRRACEGPDAVTAQRFEILSENAMTNVFKIMRGLPIRN